MTVSAKDWAAFTTRLSRLCKRAADDLRVWVNRNGGLVNVDRQALIDYAYGLATKYGEGTGALAAAWYDEVAAAAGKILPPAEAAATATYAETATAVNGVLDVSQNPDMLAGALERMVKLPGVDTTLNNAIRDGARVAWIPMGETCAFCLTLASRGWQRASRHMLKNGHAAHVHANCNCTYAVQFNGEPRVAGYDPERYREMYDDAEGRTPKDKINALRREFYAKNSEEIREQQRSAYEKRIELNSSAAEELDV